MKESILLIDNEDVFNFISTKIMEGMGVTDEIHAVSGGNDALHLINDYYSGTQSVPRLILVDLNMPVMDGFAFIEAFQRLEIPGKERTTIAIVTTSRYDNDIQRAKEMGIEHFLTKPLSEPAIRAILQKIGAL